MQIIILIIILMLGIYIGLLITKALSSTEEKKEIEQNTTNDFFCDPLIRED